MKHTELPWGVNAIASTHIVSDKRSIGSVGGYSDGTEKTHLENIANAAFIVKACNNFYEMLELLKLLTYTGDYEGRPPIEDVLNRAREAIKQAEAE